MSDPCDFLSPKPLPVENGAVRQRLFHRTLGVLRRRRWLRRSGWIAALAACYAAGVLTMHWLRPAASSHPAPEVARTEPPRLPSVEPEPKRAEIQTDRVRLLVKAADHFLAAESDPRTALYGYTEALNEGGDAALTISTDDSYLLMAIKDARQKEKRNAKNVD